MHTINLEDVNSLSFSLDLDFTQAGGSNSILDLFINRLGDQDLARLGIALQAGRSINRIANGRIVHPEAGSDISYYRRPVFTPMPNWTVRPYFLAASAAGELLLPS